jgi:hypothetical protein
VVEFEEGDLYMIQTEDYIAIRSIESGTIYKRADGILVLRQVEGKDNVTIKDLKDQLEVFLDIQKGEKSPLVVVADRLKRLDNEEKMFLTSTVTQFANKIGIVANTPIPTFIFNVFLFLTRPSIPTKIFTTETEALEWLNQN